MKLNFKGKSAVITGASGGMGLEISEKLSKNNISVKRPTPRQNQIPAKFFKNIINKKAKRNLKINQKLNWRDVK